MKSTPTRDMNRHEIDVLDTLAPTADYAGPSSVPRGIICGGRDSRELGIALARLVHLRAVEAVVGGSLTSSERLYRITRTGYGMWRASAEAEFGGDDSELA